MGWRPITNSKALAEAELPDNPRDLECAVCDTVIGAEAWDWAAMPDNGPVHQRCFMTDEQLAAARVHGGPCGGCDTDCEQYTRCLDPDVVCYGDGINNCMIVRPGDPELDDLAEEYRAQGYKVVH